MPMKNVSKQPVRGDNYFERPLFMDELCEYIANGGHVLLSAPRRVGKTSLMYRLYDRGMVGFSFIYLITEGVYSENDFFSRILEKLFDSDFLAPFQRSLKKAYQTIKDRAARITEIGKSVKFENESKLEYKKEFISLVKSLDLQGQKIVFLVDEFSQTAENIFMVHGKRTAVRFLQSCRELRQDIGISEKVQFVYAGSIGIENIVSRLNAVNLVNDLEMLKVPPLSEKEAHRLITALTENEPYRLTKGMRDYILKKVEWFIPYYLQLTLRVIHRLHRQMEAENGKAAINKRLVDRAFDQMLRLRDCFEHWHTRLRKAFKGDEYLFAQEVLNSISRNGSIKSLEIVNLGHKFNIENSYKIILNSLIYDGYINHNDDPEIYRYNSPLLKLWWRENVAT